MKSIDEIFPKEITEQDPWYGCLDDTMTEDSTPELSQDLKEAIDLYFEYIDENKPEIGESKEFVIVAMSSLDLGDEGYDGEELKELARARVRLSLNIELIPDLSDKGV